MKLDTKNITEQTISRLISTIIYTLLTALAFGLFSLFSKYSVRLSSSSYLFSWLAWLVLFGAISLISLKFIKLLKSIIVQQNDDYKEIKDKFVLLDKNLSERDYTILEQVLQAIIVINNNAITCREAFHSQGIDVNLTTGQDANSKEMERRKDQRLRNINEQSESILYRWRR